ncbi:MAG: PQQ-like beta-propeller repeat protein [Verrucomicrobia bacterium]|nr:PQQ-like beta-propeller repeat protein [Verrucomicrobiota bacterium]
MPPGCAGQFRLETGAIYGRSWEPVTTSAANRSQLDPPAVLPLSVPRASRWSSLRRSGAAGWGGAVLAAVMALEIGVSVARATPGTKLWDFTTGAPVHSSPAIGLDGTIYFGSMDRKLYALTAGGAKRWEFLTGGGIQSSPALGADETVYVGSLDGKLYAVSPTGLLRWQFAARGPVASSPAVGADGTLYFGAQDRRVYALKPNGLLHWEFLTQGEIVSSPAVAADGTVYVGSRDRRLYALAPNGTKKWEYVASGEIESSPALGAGGVIYLGVADGAFCAVAPAGHLLWVHRTSQPVYSSPAVGVDGVVYFGGHDERLYALNPDGTVRWATALGLRVGHSSPALAADGTVYVGALNGQFFAHHADGTRRWAYTVGSDVTYSSPAVAADGTVYFGANDGKLYALRGTAELAGQAWPMFRRDTRHSASGFAERDLPAAYSGGVPFTVTLSATLPASVVFYVVEDTPPANWQVGEISHNGSFDPNRLCVRFGPFFDGAPRRLSYQVTPPVGEAGSRTFRGTTWVDGAARFMGGTHRIDSQPLHPADSIAFDRWIALEEITGYGAAWKRGANWAIGPNPVPNAYLARAIGLWRSGEAYQYDTNFSLPPWWWVPTPPAAAGLPPERPAPGTAAPNGTATAALPLTYQPGTPLTVVLTVTPDTNVWTYALEDQPPAGWAIGAVENGGFIDAARGKVKWGPFFDPAPRVVSYQVTPPADATEVAGFVGWAAFDGVLGGVAGQRHVYPGATGLPAVVVRRQLPLSYSPGAKLTVTLQTAELPLPGFLIVEDAPPRGWAVTDVSHGGTFDAAAKVVRFGPFLDGVPRALSYGLTPPVSESGLEQFAGSFLVNGVAGEIAGDTRLAWAPLHPADVQPIDAWLTLAEVTAYGAAWRAGSAWSAPPNPIPGAYLSRAIELWGAGEAYRYDTNFATPPLWWVSAADPAAVGLPPALPPPGTTAPNGVVTAALPLIYQPGASLTVVLTVLPDTNVSAYAVEDEPPAGWVVARVDGGGFADAARGKVKWGPFFDAAPRVLTYQVTPPGEAVETGRFHGWVAFDGVLGEVGGQRETHPSTTGLPAVVVSRRLPPAYSPGATLTVTLETASLDPPAALVVEESPPRGWVVGDISDGGTFDAAARWVRFGPFLDGTARILTYTLTPPIAATGTEPFAGRFLVNGVRGFVAGDVRLAMAPLHPADLQPIDGWLTMTELTAYGAAWRLGTVWSTPPSPITAPYLLTAIALWQSGERYRHEPAIPTAPDWWLSAPGEVPGDQWPAGLPPGVVTTNGTVEAEVPAFFEPGIAFTVSLAVTPATGVVVYAVEESPPAGWAVSEITAGGRHDTWRHKLKWGPYFDAMPRRLAYRLLPPAEPPEVGRFGGGAAFDGAGSATVGRRQTLLKESRVSPEFTSARRVVGGGIEVVLAGIRGEVYVLQASTNLVAWRTVATLTNTLGTVNYHDTAAAATPQRYYRAYWP